MPNRNPGFARVLNLGIIPLILKFAKKYDLRKLFKTPISERWGKQICLNE